MINRATPSSFMLVGLIFNSLDSVAPTFLVNHQANISGTTQAQTIRECARNASWYLSLTSFIHLNHCIKTCNKLFINFHHIPSTVPLQLQHPGDQFPGAGHCQYGQYCLK